MFEIEGKIALITGGASGIGFQYTVELLKNGIRGVTVVDVNEELGKKVVEDLKQQFGDDKVIFLKVDVVNKDEFEDAFKKTVEKYKNIDIVINNAGIFNDRTWEKEIDINIKGIINGTLLGIQQYVHKYKSGSEGVILNMSSISGVDPTPSHPIYCASKYAIVGFTRSFGTQKHYDLSAVRILAICPGRTNTPIFDNLQFNSLQPEYLSFREDNGPLPLQTAQHVAQSAVELIKIAPHGSVWVIEDGEPAYKLPHTFRKDVKKLRSLL